MTTLEHLKISNFRGFNSLEIDGLSKVNLFIGKNNSGKTSVLEALFLLIGMSNPNLPNNVNLFRGFKNPTQQLKYIFHNLSYNNIPLFKGIFSDFTERQLIVKAEFQKDAFTDTMSSLSSQKVSGIELNFEHNNKSAQKQSYKSSLNYDTGSISMPEPSNYHELLNATFLIFDRNDMNVLQRLSEIIKRKESDKILKILKETFDNNIMALFTMPDGIYFNLKDVEEYVPIGIMGDGINRFLNIITASLEKQNSFILIDEIENGLHYTAYKQLWKSLLTFAEQENIQLFITTHSIETLTCLKSVLEEQQFQGMRDYSKIFNISKINESEHKAYKYSYQEFQTVIDNDIEIR